MIFGEYTELIGQIFGFIAVIFCFISYQMQTQKKVLTVQIFMIVSICINYYLLGAYSGLVMNIVAIVRNVVYYNKQIFKGKCWPVIMCVIIFAVGMLSWAGPLSLLVIIPLTVNTYCNSFENPNHLRISILFTSPLVLIYDIFVFSLGGILLESLAIVSSVIGIVRYNKSKRKATVL